MTYQTISVQTPRRIETPRLTKMPALGLRWRLGYGWTTLAVAIALLLSALLMTPAQARPLSIGSQRTIPSGNLHLEPGQKIDDDVIVFSGNVTLEEDAQITGDLLVMSGNIEIAEGATINGDVATFSGNIDLYGTVEGDIAAVSGNIDLYDGSKVEGDISVVSGNLTREENTEVGGETVSGQNFDFGKIFGFAGSGIADEVVQEIQVEIEAEIANARAEHTDSNRESSREQRRGGGIGSVIAGIFGALFSAFVLAILAGLVALIRPTIIKSVQHRLRDELALCFGAGLVVNVGGFLIAGVMAITIIGLLVAIPAWIALFFLNIAGGIIAAAALGERIGNYLNLSGNYPVKIAIGAAGIILSISLLWSMGGCFSFIGFLGFFLLSSIGTGALVLPWVRRFVDDDKPTRRSSDDGSQKWAQNDEPVVRGTAADETSSEDRADDEDETMASEPADSPVQAETIAPAKSAQVADEPETKPQKQVADNFTKIRGIGAVFAARLADANITTYAQLASMSAEEIGEIFGWPAERVERDDIIGQAAALADD